MAAKQTTLELALRCAKCMALAPLVEECTLSEFSLGGITLIECPNVFCKEKPWVYCHSCKKKCYKNGLLLHAQRKKHIEAHKRAYPQVTMPPPPPDPPATSNCAADLRHQGIHEGGMDDIDFEELIMEAIDEEDFEKMEMDLSTTHMENATTAMETSAPTTSNIQSVYPFINMAENEWLAKLMRDTWPATTTEIIQYFNSDGVDKMRNFWLAERGSGDGHCGGGIVYLAAKTFQQVRDSQLDKFRLPSFGEAKWQFMNCIQYQSMNEKQRIRQSMLMQESHNCKSFSSPDSFFKETFVPVFNQLGRYYGNTGQHSILNNLPTPRSRNVGGVAYVSPRNILTFLMANGIPIDNVHVDFNDPSTLPYTGTVHNSSKCRKAIDWYNSIKSRYKAEQNRTTSNLGAPNSNYGAPNFCTVIPLSVSDWADGFGPGKVKNNQSSIDCKSFTISPPKHLVNSGDNTFAGPKQAPGWPEVERLFRAELEESNNKFTNTHYVLQRGDTEVHSMFCKTFCSAF